MRFTASYSNRIESVDRNIICGCAGAVARSVYELIALSIQDEKSVTQKQLYAALRNMSKTCTGLWERCVIDKRIDENM
jgi:hypothetical protein